ncbi:hypothetical protein [Natrarchaeobaculum aegyptiacum]|nr:hypothetical protein [Natrarchaeobaculum aegyptiacum]
MPLETDRKVLEREAAAGRRGTAERLLVIAWEVRACEEDASAGTAA